MSQVRTTSDAVLSLRDADADVDDIAYDSSVADPTALSIPDTAKLRVKDGILEASIDGADWEPVGVGGSTLPSGWKTNRELGILTTNTHAQNTAAWNAAMAAKSPSVAERWLFEPGTFLFDTTASPLIVENGPVAIEATAGIDKTWFRVGIGGLGGMLFRSYGDPPGTYNRADYSSMKGIKIDGDAVGSGVECNCPVLIEDCTFTAFEIGVKVYGSVGAGTQASECEFNRVYASSNSDYGFYFDGPDANDCLVSNCTASDNGIGGFYDSSFLGNTFVKCHTEVNAVFSYKTDDSNARALFLGCYAEAGQTCEILHPSQFIGGIQGGSAAAFTGNAITFYEDEMRGRPLKFPFRNPADTAAGYVSHGGGADEHFSAFHTAEVTSPEDFFSVWDPASGSNWSKIIAHYLWGTTTGVGAFGVSGALSRNATTGQMARYPALIAENGLYVSNNYVEGWDMFDDYSGGPLAFALARYGSGHTLAMGDRFFSRYQDKTLSGVTLTTAYAWWVVTKYGTLGTYADGRTLTGNGTSTAVLSGANTSLKVGQWININGSSTRQITAISGLNVTFNNTVANAAGLTIAYIAPVISAAGRIAGTGQDDTASPGAITQNTVSGRVAIAAGAAAVVITNSRITASSNVQATLQTIDGTLFYIRAVCTLNTITITGNANATGNCNVAWYLVE